MKIPGRMIIQVIRSFFKRPVTTTYPFTKSPMCDKFRGKIVCHPEKCIGCQMCVRDCPANAIKITKIGEKRFKAEIDLGKCVYCCQCVDICPRKALESTADFELAALNREKLKTEYIPEPPKDTPVPPQG